MTYKEIKAKKTKAYNDLMEECQVFWAFSDEQFKKGLKKINLPEGEKLIRIPTGGLMPKKHFKKFDEGIQKANEESKKALKELKEEKTKAILYELKNHECFYTGEIDDVIDIFKGIYTAKAIQKVYSANYSNTNY